MKPIRLTLFESFLRAPQRELKREQARRKASNRQASTQASKQAIKQTSKHAGKHLGGIQSEPCPVGACSTLIAQALNVKEWY